MSEALTQLGFKIYTPNMLAILPSRKLEKYAGQVSSLIAKFGGGNMIQKTPAVVSAFMRASHAMAWINPITDQVGSFAELTPWFTVAATCPVPEVQIDHTNVFELMTGQHVIPELVELGGIVTDERIQGHHAAYELVLGLQSVAQALYPKTISVVRPDNYKSIKMFEERLGWEQVDPSHLSEQHGGRDFLGNDWVGSHIFQKINNGNNAFTNF